MDSKRQRNISDEQTGSEFVEGNKSNVITVGHGDNQTVVLQIPGEGTYNLTPELARQLAFQLRRNASEVDGTYGVRENFRNGKRIKTRRN